ncbi:hypothetical protein [Nocardia sp. NRRL S-836]|uniref:hypothetical protein n=1 Tax=Nocardia sp. NRRL S-836 TaxID=1519492 RepID=UPI000AD8D387|nr:hypothetical protein [Nocardia sp. NRRL S-836]
MRATAREIRSRLRRQAEAEQQKREDAVVAVGVAAAAAVKRRADNDAALRAVFEAALRTSAADGRVRKLREAFEAALAHTGRVLEAEVAAGRTVLAAAELRITQGQLAEFTGQRVEDLRRWVQLVRRAESSEAGSAVGPTRAGGGSEPMSTTPAAGFAVVMRESDDVRGDALHGDGSAASAG